ncbi:MAG: HNH endonuclease [Dehalococcoidia bacterium]|nr:HNH endonuclease [Dehalococcoidia bacterium]
MTLEERFWKYVDKRGPDECWPWVGATQSRGYGVIRRGGRNSRLERAHRVSYEIAVGPIPDGLSILHSCDNPACVNERHLRAGTHAENMRDASDRQRFPSTKAILDRKAWSEAHSTVSQDTVDRIRELGQQGLLHREIAALVGRPRRYVSRIISGERRAA